MTTAQGPPVTAQEAAEAAGACGDLAALDQAVTHCRACPRLVAWREQVALQRRAAFADEVYWGRPVPGFGPRDADILVLGLAPAAHGANRTGRMFTGDRSGDWLFAALHRAGLANQPTSVGRDDGLSLRRTRVTAAVRCAPPANRPTPVERDTCAVWLDRELQLLRPGPSVVVALGGFAWVAAMRALPPLSGGRPAFGHGARTTRRSPRGGSLTVLGCYHPSQQNTFTGRLTEAMVDDVLGRAVAIADAVRQ